MSSEIVQLSEKSRAIENFIRENLLCCNQQRCGCCSTLPLIEVPPYYKICLWMDSEGFPLCTFKLSHLMHLLRFLLPQQHGALRELLSMVSHQRKSIKTRTARAKAAQKALIALPRFYINVEFTCFFLRTTRSQGFQFQQGLWLRE